MKKYYLLVHVDNLDNGEFRIFYKNWHKHFEDFKDFIIRHDRQVIVQYSIEDLKCKGKTYKVKVHKTYSYKDIERMKKLEMI